MGHRFSVQDASAIASELIDIVNAEVGSDSRDNKMSLRGLLRQMRQRRMAGEYLAATHEVAEVARCIWNHHMASEGHSNIAESGAYVVSESLPDGVALPLAPPMKEDARKVCFLVRGLF